MNQPKKNPYVAIVLSFLLSGLGQIYNGQIGKGIGFIIAGVISVLLCFPIIGFTTIGLITTPVVWFWSVFDAYKSAQKINKEMTGVSWTA